VPRRAPHTRAQQELEPLAADTERYVFINVPYNFMFACKARSACACTVQLLASLGR
jgi:hypothetical protein